ncbi:MAG: MFS transporter, partial [Deltaproteobacteria bacterium]|nr:MFS transporter [Deltaproteobacteria bacterium]
TSVFPAGERGRAIGFNVAAVYIGLAAGPYAGGLLTGVFGWRSIFFCNVPFGLLILYLLATAVPGEWAAAERARFDCPGALFYAGSLVALMTGLSLLPGWPGLALVLLGLSGFALFARHELRSASPLFEVRLFRDNRVFAFSSLAALIHYGATFAVSFLLSLHLQYVLALGPERAGTVLLWQPLAMALLSPLAGRLSDRWEPRLLASCGMGVSALALLLLTGMGRAPATGYVVFCLICLGVGFALFSSPNMNAIMGSVEPRHFGIASGAVGAMRLIGQMSSMAVVLVVFSLTLGGKGAELGTHPALPVAVRRCFSIMSALCAAGIGFSLARGNLRGGSPPEKEHHGIDAGR